MGKDLERVLNGLDQQVETMMQQWNLPGMSMAIVKDGEIVLTRAYGSRDEKQNLPMETDTVQPIGSATKSFTALILGMLADEGKLDWDKPVKEYIPWLKLYDPVATEQVTARDLCSHRTGLPKCDVHGVFCTKDDRKAMVEELRYLPNSAEFRTQLQYSNQMVMLAGYLAEVLTGQSWEELVRERILEPLGMKDTCMTIGELEEKENRSKGYLFTGTENMELPYLSLRGIGPAGAMNSTAEDMAKYMLLQLSDGSWDGTQLISKAQLDEMHTAQMNGTPYFWKLDEMDSSQYGLCWFVDQYRGHKMVSHGGNTLGFSTLMTLIPEENFGVILITNANSNFIVYPLTYTIVDRLLGVEEEDWTAKMQAKIGEVFGQMGAAMAAKEAARTPDTVPSHPLADFCGIYTHPAYGTMELFLQGDVLTGKLNGFDMAFAHYHYDVFDATILLMGVGVQITFCSNEAGAVDGLSAVMEPTVAPAQFVKEK